MPHRDRILKQARHGIRNGRLPVPVPAGQKGPIRKNWTQLRLTEEELDDYFIEKDVNIGWLTGEPSGNLVDIDLDCDAAVSLAKNFLPATDRVHGRKRRPSSHYWFYCEVLPAPMKFTDVDGESLAELRSSRQQTLIPPSIHPSKERLRWEKTGEPARIDGHVLQAAVGKVGAATILTRHWPKVGQRHEAAKALAGMLLRGGWNEDGASEFIQAIAEVAGDEEFRARAGDVASTAKRLAAGGTTTGLPTLASIIGDEVVARVRRWLGLAGPPEVDGPDGWPDPSSLGDDLPPVDAFKIDLLPTSLRHLVEDVSERMQTPPDYAAVAAVVSLAGCVNRRAVMRPKAQDRSWTVIPNLWGVIVAPPGFMKSPVLHAVTSGLTQIEDLWRAEHAQRIANFQEEKEQAELREANWRSQARQAMAKGGPVPLKPDTSITPPVERRLMTTDSTFEKLHEILAANPAGVFVVRDEISGWLAGLDREGREGERAFFLQAWSGNAGYTIDRIGRGSIHVPAVCLSLIGTIQPAKLRFYLGDAVRGGVNDDGLLQRFQVTVWPDPPTAWALVDRPPRLSAATTAQRVYARLAHFSADNPIELRFAADAQQLFYKWWERLESKVRSESGLHPAMVGHLAKYRSLMPTLAALFEMADLVAEDRSLTDESLDVLVNLDHAQQAVDFCTYLESHANRVYSCIVSPQCRAARELGRHLKKGDLPSPFTTRMIYLKGWAGLDSPDSVRSALAVLQEICWIRRIDTTPAATGGRPSESWLINPKLGV